MLDYINLVWSPDRVFCLVEEEERREKTGRDKQVRKIHLGPKYEEWTILSLGPANIIFAIYIVGFKKKREILQIHIKQGTNHVDLLMDEVVQNNMPFQNRPFNFSFKY